MLKPQAGELRRVLCECGAMVINVHYSVSPEHWRTGFCMLVSKVA